MSQPTLPSEAAERPVPGSERIGGRFERPETNGANGAAPVRQRKAEHLRINVEEDVGAKGIDTGFAEYRFVHDALPELDLDDVSCASTLFGRQVSAPVLISCMTGGTREARAINARLADVAAELGLAIGLGSGRAMLEHPELRPSFDVRSRAPEALVFANLGAVQLAKGVDVDDCRRLLDDLGADALVLHLDPLQEALPQDGDTEFEGLLPRIADLCRRLDQPVIVKEVGWGLADDVARALFGAGVSGVDVAGAGTSWSEVERHRLTDRVRQRVAAAFADWGIPTAEAVRGARRAAPDGIVLASGGIADGIDVAKSLALGADLAGLAGPFLRAAAEGTQSALELGREPVATLRLVMLCIGARSVPELRDTPRLIRSGRGSATYSETLEYRTGGSGDFIDVTDDVSSVVARSGVRDGQVNVFSNHTTAAIRVNENEPRLLEDFRRFLTRVAPEGGYLHDDLDQRVGIPADEPINGHSHCRHLLLSSSESIPVTAGALLLGTWQRVFLIELCSARTRKVTVQVMG